MNANFDIEQMFVLTCITEPNRGESLTCLRRSRQTPRPPPPPGPPPGRSPPGQGVNVEQFVIKKKEKRW